MSTLGRWLTTPTIVAFLALFPVWAACLIVLGITLHNNYPGGGVVALLLVLWVTSYAFQCVRRQRHPWVVWFVAISLLLCFILGNLSMAVPGLGLLFLPSAVGMIAVAGSMRGS